MPFVIVKIQEYKINTKLFSKLLKRELILLLKIAV